MRIKKGDKVKVITGKDRKKEGIVLQAFPKTKKVVVEGIRVATKHVKPTQANPDGGLKKKEQPIDVSNVMLIDPKDKKHVTRIRYEIVDNKKVRIAVKSKGKI